MSQTQPEGFLPAEPQLIPHFNNSTMTRVLMGGAFLGAAGAAIWGITQGNHSEGHITADMPFISEVQTGVTQIDDVIKTVGEVGLVTALTTVGGVKLASRWSSTARAVDFASSQEMTNDGNHNPGVARRILQSTFAGNVPVIASVGVALGTFTGAISTEVSEGPSRPIEALGAMAPGDSMVVQYPGAMPMVQSNVNAGLSSAVQAEANRRHVRSTSVGLNLGTMVTQDGQSLSDLSIGMSFPEGSPLDWKPTDGCELIPVAVDKSARVDNGERVNLNGMEAKVVDQINGASAINRVGILIDKDAQKNCLEQNPDSGDHAVVLDTDPKTASEILEAANPNHAPATVITKDDYEKNSEEFWVSNVKPITNVLAVAAAGAVILSLGGNLRARMLRNRREWAADFARHVSNNKMRAVELLRGTKDAILASGIGITAAILITPVANTIVAGFRAGVGYKEAMIGAGVATVGSIFGTLARVIHPRKTINPREYTR